MFFLFQLGSLSYKNNYKGLYYYHKNISKNKSFEFEIVTTNDIFELQIDTRLKGRDHAGPSLSLSIFGYNVAVRIYDHRHWDYKNNTWIKYNENNT